MHPWPTMLPFGLEKKGIPLTLHRLQYLFKKPEYHKRVVELLKEFYPNRNVEGKNVRVYKVVFSMYR